jgi:hypothetical protein
MIDLLAACANAVQLSDLFVQSGRCVAIDSAAGVDKL